MCQSLICHYWRNQNFKCAANSTKIDHENPLAFVSLPSSAITVSLQLITVVMD